MIVFYADPRLVEALVTGRIPGLSGNQVAEALMVGDLLRGIITWADARFMFPSVARIDDRRWRVPIAGAGHMSFEWADGFGPINLRLHE